MYHLSPVLCLLSEKGIVSWALKVWKATQGSCLSLNFMLLHSCSSESYNCIKITGTWGLLPSQGHEMCGKFCRTINRIAKGVWELEVLVTGLGSSVESVSWGRIVKVNNRPFSLGNLGCPGKKIKQNFVSRYCPAFPNLAACISPEKYSDQGIYRSKFSIH